MSIGDADPGLVVRIRPKQPRPRREIANELAEGFGNE